MPKGIEIIGAKKPKPIIYEVYFYDKNGSGLAYQGTDYKKAKEREKEVREDIGKAPYFITKVELLKNTIEN